MFEGITDSLKGAFANLRGTRLTEKNIRDGLKQVRQALLEADVNYEVAQAFIKRVTEQAVGDEVLASSRPEEQILGIVYQELIVLMGPEETGLRLKERGTTVLMMCGLQGSGKTTTCGKLAKMLKREGYKPMLVAADLQRPAAIEQLKTLGAQIDVSVYAEDPAKSNPVQVCKNGLKQAQKEDVRVVILDTAGRLHIDDALMNELEAIDLKCSPDQVLMVCDAMTGQDAVKSAAAFNEALELDGVILSKMDGDTRGGAALSVRAVTGVPLLFLGVGEDLDGLQPFRSDGIAQRILGQGDLGELARMMSMTIDQEKQLEIESKMREGKFTLNDFREQMAQLGKGGMLKKMMKLIPGFGDVEKMLAGSGFNPEKDMKSISGIIDSMTPRERDNPDVIDRSRRNRIAKGCGMEPSDVNNLLKQFNEVGKIMGSMAGMGHMERVRMAQNLMQESAANPGGELKSKRKRSKRGPSVTKHREERKKKKKQAKKQRKKNRK